MRESVSHANLAGILRRVLASSVNYTHRGAHAININPLSLFDTRQEVLAIFLSGFSHF